MQMQAARPRGVREVLMEVGKARRAVVARNGRTPERGRLGL